MRQSNDVEFVDKTDELKKDSIDRSPINIGGGSPMIQGHFNEHSRQLGELTVNSSPSPFHAAHGQETSRMEQTLLVNT